MGTNDFTNGISVGQVRYATIVNEVRCKTWQLLGMSRNLSGWYSLDAEQAMPPTLATGTNKRNRRKLRRPPATIRSRSGMISQATVCRSRRSRQTITPHVGDPTATQH